MITRIYEGTSQAQRVVMARQLQCPARSGWHTRHETRWGVDVGGGIDPVSSHCSMSYSAEINL
jgi:hypothetical protein